MQVQYFGAEISGDELLRFQDGDEILTFQDLDESLGAYETLSAYERRKRSMKFKQERIFPAHKRSRNHRRKKRVH